MYHKQHFWIVVSKILSRSHSLIDCKSKTCIVTCTTQQGYIGSQLGMPGALSDLILPSLASTPHFTAIQFSFSPVVFFFELFLAVILSKCADMPTACKLVVAAQYYCNLVSLNSYRKQNYESLFLSFKFFITFISRFFIFFTFLVSNQF